MADTTHIQCVNAVADAVEALATGLTVRRRKLWIHRESDVLPAIHVCPMGVETMLDATNTQDDTGYPVTVVFLAASNQDLELTPAFNALLAARKAVRQAFRNKRLTITDGTVLLCRVEPGPVIDPQSFGVNYDASLLVIRVQAREARS